MSHPPEEELFRALIETALDATLLLTRDGTLTYVSPAISSLLGYTPQEFLQSTPFALLLADDQPRARDQFETAKSNPSDSSPISVRMKHKDGSWPAVEMTTTNQLDDPRVQSVVIRLRSGKNFGNTGSTDEPLELSADSERQRLIYEAALSSTPDLVYVFGLDHRFVYANKALLRMWGRTREDALGKNCLELGYEPWHAAMHDREIDQVVATKRPIRGDVPFTGTNGRRIYDYIFVPVLGHDGAVVAVAGTTRDVTERNQAEEALKEADHRKDEFLAMLAHELRNPLSAIASAARLMQMVELTDVLRWSSDVIGRQVGNLTRMIEDLLEVSRITQGKIQLKKQYVDVPSLLSRAIESTQPIIAERRHAVNVSQAPGNYLVDADPTRIEQIFVNLLTNAARFTDPEGQIDVKLSRDGGEVVVSVRDNGMGIASETLPHIFKLFAQADQGLDRSQGGLGIGLTIVEKLVEMHGGRISAQSKGTGQGSEFIVRLPGVSEPTKAVIAPPTITPRSKVEPSILIVDDNIDAALTIRTLLEAVGHDVRTAHDGRTAVEVARTFRPGCIVLDLGLPGMNGFEVASAIRKVDGLENTMIIALTGYGNESDRIRSRAAGFDHHLVKPLNFDVLRALIKPRVIQS